MDQSYRHSQILSIARVVHAYMTGADKDPTIMAAVNEAKGSTPPPATPTTTPEAQPEVPATTPEAAPELPASEPEPPPPEEITPTEPQAPITAASLGIEGTAAPLPTEEERDAGPSPLAVDSIPLTGETPGAFYDRALKPAGVDPRAWAARHARSQDPAILHIAVALAQM